MGKKHKKRLLIYAHYYAPDVASTGQILQDMAEGMSDEFDVTVICTVPSYTGSVDTKYKVKKKRFYWEWINGIKVIRIAVPEFKKTSKLSRIRNLLAYFLGAIRATKLVGLQDYVFTISQPPILGGMLGVYAKRTLLSSEGERPTFIYCIQDFNPEQVIATGYIKLMPILMAAKHVDIRSCSNSDLVVTVGRDLEETLLNRFVGKTVPRHTMINNWIDEKEIYPLPADDRGVEEFNETYGLKDKFIIMYSGNLGLYYDLEGLMGVMEKFRDARAADGRQVVFAFVGAGALLNRLVKYKEEHGMDNVVFIPYQDKEKLIYSLNAADVHWCVSARGIKGVSCPSKFYGIAGVGKPVLGVLERGSEIEMLIDEIGCGKVSEPEDYKAVEENLRWFIDKAGTGELIEMGKKAHDYLIKNLTKGLSIAKYKRAIKSYEQQLVQNTITIDESQLRTRTSA